MNTYWFEFEKDGNKYTHEIQALNKAEALDYAISWCMQWSANLNRNSLKEMN